MVINEVKKIISQVAGIDKLDKEKKSLETIQIVVFSLLNEEYALKITDIQEIIEIPEITPIPSSPDFISGILNLRGKIVVVVDLEKRFSVVREVNSDKPRHIIITEIDGSSYGITVDQVKEVMRIETGLIQSTPDLITSKISEDFFNGVVVLETKETEAKKSSSRLIIILNLQNLLKEKELMALEDTIKKTTKDTAK